MDYYGVQIQGKGRRGEEEWYVLQDLQFIEGVYAVVVDSHERLDMAQAEARYKKLSEKYPFRIFRISKLG